jgi:hypothetical protein
MKAIRAILLLVAALMTVTAVHAARTAPLVGYENVLATSIDGKPLTTEQVRKAIIMAAASKQWVASALQGDTLRLTHSRGKHTAVVDVVYTAQSYSIRYVDSSNLNYDAVKGAPIIHPTYNGWVNNLRAAIDAALRAV